MLLLYPISTQLFIGIYCTVGLAAAAIQLADITMCLADHNSSPSPGYPRQLMFGEGRRMELCCYLRPRACSNTTDSDSLTLHHLNPTSDVLLASERQSRCVARLVIESAATSDGGLFTCHRNNAAIVVENITVLKQPNVPYISQLVTSEQYEVEIVLSNLTDGARYDVRKDHPIEEDMCTLNCSEGKNCICKYVNKKEPILYKDRNITVTINVTKPAYNPVTSVTARYSYNLVQCIRPEKVASVHLFSITSNEAILHFQPSWRTNFFMFDMCKLDKPYVFKITVNKNYGSLHRLEVNLTKAECEDYSLTTCECDGLTYHTSCDDDHDDCNKSVVVRLTHLFPSTSYAVSVSGVGGGGEGAATSFSFSTGKSVPTMSPVIEEFCFSRYRNAEGMNCLFLVWKPLPSEHIGGDDVWYKVNLSSTNETATKSTYFKTCPVSRDELTVRIWAHNEIGMSRTNSTITIPKDASSPLTSLYVEMRRERHIVTIYLHLPNYKDIENLAIHWCWDRKNNTNKNICTAYPQTKLINKSTVNLKEYLSFNITIRSHEKAARKIFNQTVEYFDANNFDHFNITGVLDHVKVAQATVTVQQGVDDDVITADEPRFFLSVNSEERWSGMKPAVCHFTQHSSDAPVVVNVENIGENKLALRVRQKCDYDNPTYFLARDFLIYFSASEDCKVNVSQKHLVKNVIFQDSQLEVLNATSFLCTVAVGFDGVTSEVTVTRTDRIIPAWSDAESDRFTAIYIAVTLVLVIFASLCIPIGYRRCKKRRAHFLSISTDKEMFRETHGLLVDDSMPSVAMEVRPLKDAKEVSRDSGIGDDHPSTSDDHHSVSENNARGGVREHLSVCHHKTSATVNSGNTVNCGNTANSEGTVNCRNTAHGGNTVDSGNTVHIGSTTNSDSTATSRDKCSDDPEPYDASDSSTGGRSEGSESSTCDRSDASDSSGNYNQDYGLIKGNICFVKD